MNKAGLRALIYNRVSSDPTGRRVSVESQNVENRAFCDRLEWQVAATVTDNDRSASRYAVKEREGYAEVRDSLAGQRHGRIDVLVCWESSRAQRDLGDYVALRDLCAAYRVLLAYKGRVYDLTQGDDRFATGLDALVDEREAERIRDRLLRGQRTSAAKGRPHGVTPYGFVRLHDTATGKLIGQEIDPDTAPVVRDLVARVLDGDTLYAIAADLNERGVPTPQSQQNQRAGREEWAGHGWTSSKIRRVLTRTAVIGVRTHHGVPHESATWPELVSEADWQRVQAVLANPSRRYSRGTAPAHLLSGIAECGVCGAWLRPQSNRGRPVYQCHGITPTSPKGHVSRPREPLEAMVVHQVLRQLAKPTFLADLAALEVDPRPAAAAAEVAALRARLADFEQKAIVGDVTPEGFSRIEAGLLPRIAEAQARAVPTTVSPDVVGLAGPDAAARWAELARHPDGMVRQRGVVRHVVRIVVNRSAWPRGRRGFDRDSVALTWRQ